MLKQRGWTDKNYSTLKKMIAEYRLENFNSKWEKNYVVSDWDNTTIIFDIEEAVFMYQLLNLKYNMKLEEFLYVVKKDIDVKPEELDKINSIVDEIGEDYKYILEELKIKTLEEVKESCVYESFVVKMVYIYVEVATEMSYKMQCYRILYLFYNMSEDEVRVLSREAIDYWMNESIGRIEFKTVLRNGETLEFTHRVGIRNVPEKIELFSELRKNNIDVYICTSSSQIVIEEFAIGNYGYGFSSGEIFGLNLLKGEEERFLAEVDEREIAIILEGKAEILKKLERHYKKPPLLYIGDSDGDYYALTYSGLKFGLIINRDGGDLIFNLKKEVTMENYRGETKYLLQGRDEKNAKFINSENSINI
ncbi:hypothetical protein SAMN02745245_00756 [Anaerosphaera aminiphila DSM 21120]|uniref:phosphoserine phosphatase n=1 Tax=Anaerosphaera aminiphila DSM 21120 TaxID=1120995 RepID=A0A1M5QV51_9FIRM|nr:HAD family hydrolase [Anaerosphaera aminiphila]SHH18034.1 hypothetical protein SAMN02745245_00756 [Anaerosphaera aminiphila DSM 21120]